MKTMTLTDKFTAALLAGTPLIGITCYDPEATMATLHKEIKNQPVIQWDCIQGWRPRTDTGKNAIKEACKSADKDVVAGKTANPVEQLEVAANLPEETVLFMINSHNYFDNPAFLQAAWNLRDEFKTNGRTLVFLAPHLNIPGDIKNDVILFDEELPDAAQLRGIVNSVIDPMVKAKVFSHGVTVDDAVRDRAVDALRGIPAFAAEQCVAMASTVQEAGLQVDQVWEYKRKMINDTPGLKVYGGTEKFDDLGGCDAVKTYLRRVIAGKDAPRVIVFIDEGEKMFAGATNDVGDNTGVSQDALGTTLSFMEDNECDGAVFVGPPGAAKSAIAKAMGNEAGVPTIMLDFGGLRGSLVGESERKLREAYKIVDAVGGGKAFFVMTCNKDAALPPELKRRFTSGTFFFDLPTREERETIWKIYLDKYGFDDVAVNAIEFDKDWTGAEIRNCCRMAYRQGISLEEAAQYIIPVAESAADQIERLRNSAAGKYLSASRAGKYSPHVEKPSLSSYAESKQRQVKTSR
jgi:hypothetical protein